MFHWNKRVYRDILSLVFKEDSETLVFFSVKQNLWCIVPGSIEFERPDYPEH
jgi:hypothetical protein